eukprot:gene561-605_t
MIFCKRALLDQINNAVFPALQGGPHNNNIAALAVALKEAQSDNFKEYISQVKRNAVVIADELMKKGYVVVTNGTDNHLVLWDARPTGLSGSKLEKILERCAISVNKNSIYGDVSAVTPGGIRLGTPAMTTRGMRELDMVAIVALIDRAVKVAQDIRNSISSKKLVDFVACLDEEPYLSRIVEIRRDVASLATSFPLP